MLAIVERKNLPRLNFIPSLSKVNPSLAHGPVGQSRNQIQGSAAVQSRCLDVVELLI